MEYQRLINKVEELEREIKVLKEKGNSKGFFKKLFSRMNVIIGVTLTVIISSIVLYAAQITFTDGTVISAGEVNNNFNELYDVAWSKSGNDLYYNNGNVGVGTDSPQSALQVDGGYLQIDTVPLDPPAADCSDPSQHGRMVVSIGYDILYVCTLTGWINK